MRIAVKDANVFIDLESMGILDLWFQLGYQTQVRAPIDKGDKIHGTPWGPVFEGPLQP